MHRPPDTLLRRVTFMALLISLLLARTPASGAGIQGVWMIEDEVAVEIADCAPGALCGRVVWLKTPRDAAGALKRDLMNPDATLRKHLVCGLTVIEGLRPEGPARWEVGSFYDPRDGERYSIAMELESADVLVARVYRGLRILGKSQTLLRARAAHKVWC